MEKILDINNEIEKGKKVEKGQNNFLHTMLGQAINAAVDIGIRALLPNFVEDQIINIKDNLLNYGLKDGISKTVQDTIELGKSAVGIVTGSFENISQMQNAVKEGGIIDGVSTALDFTLNQVQKAGVINSSVANIIKTGKNVILNNVESNIEKDFKNQVNSENSLSKYIESWKKEYNNKDFENMDKTYQKMKTEMEKLVPIEEKIKEFRKIENIQTLIANKGKNFNLSETEIELANQI